MGFVGDTLGHHASLRGGETALACGDACLSWRELLENSRRLEEALGNLTGSRARIGLSPRQPFEAICLVLAVARSGRVAVVADPNQTGFPAADLSAALSFRFWSLAELDDAAALPGVHRREIDVADAEAHSPTASDPFYVGLTSGSTGRPKAFQRSHGSWLRSFAACEAAFGLTCDDRIAVPGSLSHSLHLFGALHALHLGARLDLFPRFQPRSILDTLRSARSTVLYATPTQLDLLVRSARAQGVRLPDVRRVLLSGAKWHGVGGDAADVFCGARFHEFYGTSETSFISTRSAGDPPTSVGRPFDGVCLDIRDDAGRSLPAGETGLIHVSSDMTFDGYVYGEDPDTLRDGKWLSVGDWGYVDATGALHLRGRRSRMLVCAGVNVFAEEIEAVLLNADNVGACAVFGRPDPLRGQRIVAALRPENTASPLLPDALRRHCLAHLDPIKVPRAFYMLDDWPLTAGGKPDLVALSRRVAELEDGA
ncbi:AMP-binding protein [Stappia sp. ES.058]|uniref:AMP-binding protein n=1 Tax=Stappia sp. ES.058 TaxID=1881061 RepID=UPI00087CF49C|nr:AMP-binding protein [Stappia sp. ES.058]SDU37446.1 long-chain acyl-CoA synthetase [Stappia sp. ES.058]